MLLIDMRKQMYINLVDPNRLHKYIISLYAKNLDPDDYIVIIHTGKNPWDAINRYADSVGHKFSWYYDDYIIEEVKVLEYDVQPLK